MSVISVILVVLLILFVLGIPGVGFTHNYGWGPSGALGTILVVLLALWLLQVL